MTPPEVRALGIQLARALEAAHARGILHRDVKPANVLLHPTGQWKLADFGVAHVPDSTATMTGQFLGTPAYAAPEAVVLGQFSDKSDVFGLAAMLVEALTGERLRGNASLSEIVQTSDESLVIPPAVPPELAGSLRAALSRDAKLRPTAAEFADQLAGASSQPAVATAALTVPPAHRAPEQRRKLGPIIGAAAGAILLIGLVAALASRGGGEKAEPAAKMPGPSADPTPVADPVEDPPPSRPPPGKPHGDPKHAAKEWNDVKKQIDKGHYEEALEHLDHWEDHYGATPESEQLRAWLEQQGGGREED
jgi:serine/threonine-protein kinase